MNETCTATCSDTKTETFNLVGPCSSSPEQPPPSEPDSCAVACKSGATCTLVSLEVADCCSNTLGACDKSGEKYIRKCAETTAAAAGETLTPTCRSGCDEGSVSFTCAANTAPIFECSDARGGGLTARHARSAVL